MFSYGFVHKHTFHLYKGFFFSQHTFRKLVNTFAIKYSHINVKYINVNIVSACQSSLCISHIIKTNNQFLQTTRLIRVAMNWLLVQGVVPDKRWWMGGWMDGSLISLNKQDRFILNTTVADNWSVSVYHMFSCFCFPPSQKMSLSCLEAWGNPLSLRPQLRKKARLFLEAIETDSLIVYCKVGQTYTHYLTNGLLLSS